ncbi:hypothetical protein Cni_G19515 [Canna indica]|uniref:Bromo domain-containing protein n=1 Tax=Canna indica TaxID=4628 RepID=A0AAQ3QIL4_9LILI|nr:hypothetical protein Cni_G19515 [Canna indica]
MGNNSRAAVDAAKRRKKKGRPSLLDLQKRSLRLQNHQQQNDRSPNPNPYLRFPQSAIATPSSSSRRVTRRNPNPPQEDPPRSSSHDDDDEDEDEEDGGSRGKRREKKLKLVLRLPSGSAGSASESDADPKRRKTAHGNRDEKDERNDSMKVMDSVPGKQSDLGPATPLPDNKLLAFILDRLQKKDTYGVFSEPVDPEELPDYHDIIEHPMDFGTVRKKLSSGAYTNLEQFEKDVFLISSNAMRYNAPDTIYYRQARSIQELAKKNFENLRRESDDEPEPKTVVRRGRPPNKNKKNGQPPADRPASDFSADATLANVGGNAHWSSLAHETSKKVSSGDKPGIVDVSNRMASYSLHNTDTFGWTSEWKADRNEYSGSSLKAFPSKNGKKPTTVDESRRNTYDLSLFSAHSHESIFTFDGEKKQLVPVGLYFEYAYARSLARFAAKLGPIGWDLASKKIQRALPPGTKFGPGWVGDSEAPQHSQPPVLSISPTNSSATPVISPCSSSRTGKVVNEDHFGSTVPSASLSSLPSKTFNVPEYPLPNRSSHENHTSTMASGGADSDIVQPKVPFQHDQNPVMQQTADGFNTSFNFNMDSQLAKMIRPAGIQSGPFSSEAQVNHAHRAHAQPHDMASRDNSNNFIGQTAERPMPVDNCSIINSKSRLPFPGNVSKLPWQSVTLQPKLDSVPPDLNVGFHSVASPASTVVIDSQQPDLALQL